MVTKQIWNGTMIKQSKLFKDLRKLGATIKQTKNGHHKIKHKTFTYNLSNGFEHSKEYHKWIVKDIYKRLKLK